MKIVKNLLLAIIGVYVLATAIHLAFLNFRQQSGEISTMQEFGQFSEFDNNSRLLQLPISAPAHWSRSYGWAITFRSQMKITGQVDGSGFVEWLPNTERKIWEIKQSHPDHGDFSYSSTEGTKTALLNVSPVNENFTINIVDSD